MHGKKKLTEALYLVELNATLDEIASGYNVQLPHFKQLPTSSEPMVPAHVKEAYARLYLQADQIMRKHFELIV